MELFFLSYVKLSLFFETLRFASYMIILTSTTSNLSKHATPITPIWKKQTLTLKIWNTKPCCINFSVFSSDNKWLSPIQSTSLFDRAEWRFEKLFSEWLITCLFDPIEASVSPDRCTILDWVSSWNRLLMSF